MFRDRLKAFISKGEGISGEQWIESDFLTYMFSLKMKYQLVGITVDFDALSYAKYMWCPI